MVAASLVATVSGDPTYREPLSTSLWNRPKEGGAYLRSRDDVSYHSFQYGQVLHGSQRRDDTVCVQRKRSRNELQTSGVP